LAHGTAHAPLGALGTASGPAEREQVLRGAPLRGVSELLTAQVIGELVHEDPLFPDRGGLVMRSTLVSRPGSRHT
jgi:hypothetical protein